MFIQIKTIDMLYWPTIVVIEEKDSVCFI